MSNSWDPTALPPGAGGGVNPTGGGVKLFDPVQFMTPHYQPQHQSVPTTQADTTHQQQGHQHGNYFPEHGQGSQWDHWGNWNWNSEGHMPIAGEHGEGATHSTSGQPEQFEGQNHEAPSDQDPQAAYYSSQQYYGGGITTPEGTAVDGVQPGFHGQWAWNPEQGHATYPPQEGNIEQAGEGTLGNQYYYQGQQAYYHDPTSWNSMDPTGAQPYQQWVAQGEGQETVAFNSQDAHLVSDQGTQDNHHAGYAMNPAIPHNSASMQPTPPSLVGMTALSQMQHVRQGSVDSSASGTVAHFYGHADDEGAQDQDIAQGQVSASAAGEGTSMQLLKVNSFHRTDSAISNASLQTVNLSADEDSKDGVEEATLQLASLQVGEDRAGGEKAPVQAPAGGDQPSQLYAQPGDFSGFGNYTQPVQMFTTSQAVPESAAPLSSGPMSVGLALSSAVSSGSGDSDLQSPMLNDWEIVPPPQAHSSASHSRSASMDDTATFSSRAEATEPAGAQVEETKPPQKIATPGVNPAGTVSSSTQDSESFTAISSTSSEVQTSAPFSQGSSYQPTASSTPLTSPGSRSLTSQPSSLPSWQSSPQKEGDASITSASPGVLPPPASAQCRPPTQDSPGQSVTSSIHSSPDKAGVSVAHQSERSLSSSPHRAGLDVSQGSKDTERSLYTSAISSTPLKGSSQPSPTKGESGRPPAATSQGSKGSEVGLSSQGQHHHSAFQPVHSRRAKHNMSPATTLWDNQEPTPVGNILLAPAVPLIIPSLGSTTAMQGSVITTTTTATTSATSTQPKLQKSASDSSSLERLAGKDGARRSREREGARYGGSYRRAGEKSGGANKGGEELSRSREEDNRSLGSLDELDAAPDLTDDSSSRGYRSRNYGRDPRDPKEPREPRYEPYYDRPSSRSDSYRDDYRRPRDPRDPYRGYVSYPYRDPRDAYYDEKYDRPRSRQDEERSTSRPSSRSARDKDMDRPRSRSEYDRDSYSHRDHYRAGYPGYNGYGHQDYYYDDRERFYRYYRDSRYRHGYAEEMGQYYGQQPQPYDARSHQDYYSRSSRPSSRSERERDYAPAYGGGYEGYGGSYGGYYDQYNQYQQYYGYQQYSDQQQGGYLQGRMTPPKHVLPHVRVCFSPTGQLVTVLPTRPAEGQTPTVEIHDLQVLLQNSCPEMEELKAFPGPLVRNETHKNDVLHFCQTKARECAENVDMLDRDSAELIWKLLDLLLKQNGVIIGTDIADLLLQGHEPSTHQYKVSGVRILQGSSSDPLGTPEKDDNSGASSPALTRTSTDRTVITAAQMLEDSTDRFRNLLLYGRKKEALDWAMKQNLWGHALFLASKMDNRTYASVMTRFANTAMRMNDPLQTLYQLMSGRQPASVTNVVDERWGDWRPHLAIILSNHSTRPDMDKKSIVTLGDTLATKHCLHASHFCYLMAEVEFGSFAKKASKIVLIGSNHNLPLWEFASNAVIQCTEVYEYACTLGNSKFSLPQFQVYKFLYACRLVEYGLIQEALHYFEVIAKQVIQNPAHFHPSFISILYSMSCHLKHGDPQKLHSGHDSADPEWLNMLNAVCHGYEEGSLQYNSGSGTPAITSYGAQTPSSESGEMASYGMDTTNTATIPGRNTVRLYPQDTSAGVPTVSNNNSAATYQQHGDQGGITVGEGASQGEANAQQQQQQYTGTEQYGQYGQTAEQYNWQHQQQQHDQQHDPNQYQQQHDQQQQYDPSQYQQQHDQQQQYDPKQYQQQWHAYSHGYGTEQTMGTAGYQSTVAQQGAADPSAGHNQPHQHQQQYSYNSYSQQQQQLPQQRHSLTSQDSATEQTEGDEDDDDDDDDEEDDNDDVDGERGGSNFDYFAAASQQKIVVPPSRYRTTSTSSAGSSSQRRRRTMSGSSTGSIRASKSGHNVSAAAPPRPDSKSKAVQDKNGGGAGWLGGLFSKFGRTSKNEMKLPDDKNPSIVWDSVNKKWVNKDGSEDDNTIAAPPPTDLDLMGKMAGPLSSGPPAAMNGPTTTNRFSMQRARGSRYVDVLNPSGGSSGAVVPPNLFNVLPGGTANTVSASAGTTAPQLLNPAGLGRSSGHSKAPSLGQDSNTLAPPSHEAQELGEEGTPASDAPPVSQPGPTLPMLFNPAKLSQAGGTKAASGGGAPGGVGKMKYGQRRVYPK